MALLNDIEKDYLAAYKAGEKEKVAVLRMLKAAIKNKRVELGRDLTEDDAVLVVTKQAKQRQEAIEQYKNAGRDDLASKEAGELKILNSYLPEPLTTRELNEIIDQAVAATGAKGPKDMGPVMKNVMEKVKGRADGKVVSDLVRTRLSI